MMIEVAKRARLHCGQGPTLHRKAGRQAGRKHAPPPLRCDDSARHQQCIRFYFAVVIGVFQIRNEVLLRCGKVQPLLSTASLALTVRYSRRVEDPPTVRIARLQAT